MQGVALDGIEYPSEEYSYDTETTRAFTQTEGVEPRGLSPADTVEWANWREFRRIQLAAFVPSLCRSFGRPPYGVGVGAFVEPRALRESHIQDWQDWVKARQLRWLVVRTGARTGAGIDSLLAGTPEEAGSLPWGVVLDASLPSDVLRDQIAVVRRRGGRVLAASDAALAAAPAIWRELWGEPAAKAPSSTGGRP